MRCLQQGLTVANGIAFSPVARTLYFLDSQLSKVWQASWDEEAGALGLPRLLCTSDEAAGRPNGAAVDSAGNYGSAGVSAGVLKKFAPDGSSSP